MLNSNTRKALKTLTTVGGAAILRYPWTCVLQKNKSLIAFLNLEELGEEDFEEFGVENLSDLLNLIEFYEDPNIEYNDGVITITSGNFIQHYGVSDLDTMKSYDVKETTLKKIEETPEIISFEITKDELTKLKKIASITKATSFVVGNGEIIVGKLDRNKNFSDETTVQHPMENTDDLYVEFGISNILKLPDRDYEVSIKQSQKTQNCISLWKVNGEPIQIVVAVQNTFRR